MKTSSALLADEEIRTQLANGLTTQIFSSGVVQAEVAKALPPKAAVLAGPASAGLSQLFNKAVDKLLQTSAVQGLWEEANRKASETFIAIANDEPIATEALGKAQSAAGGTSLDLTSIKAAITEKLGIKLPESGLGSGEAAQAAVQAGDAQAGLEVIAPDQISTIRDIATPIQKGTVVLLLLTVLLYVIAIAITAGARMRTVTSVGISLILIGVATLTARKLLGTMLVDELAANRHARQRLGQAGGQCGLGDRHRAPEDDGGRQRRIRRGHPRGHRARRADPGCHAGAGVHGPGLAGSDVGVLRNAAAASGADLVGSDPGTPRGARHRPDRRPGDRGRGRPPPADDQGVPRHRPKAQRLNHRGRWATRKANFFAGPRSPLLPIARTRNLWWPWATS